MSSSKAALFVCILFLTVSSGCRRDSSSMPQQMNDYVKTVQSGITDLPWPKQMEKCFGEGDHFITHYGMSSGPKTWNSEVFLFGRYVLTLQVDVDIDYKRNAVVKPVAKPIFRLVEIESVTEGGREARFSEDWSVTEQQWNSVVTNGCDWTATGISVKTNSPVAGFHEYVSGLRKPRVQIPR